MVTQQQEAQGLARWQKKVRDRGGQMVGPNSARIVVADDPASLRSIALRNRVDGSIMYVKPEELSYYLDPFVKPLRLSGFNQQATEARVDAAEGLFELHDPSKNITPLSPPPEPAVSVGRPARRGRKRRRGRRG